MLNSDASVARPSARSESLDGPVQAEHAHRVANDMALVIAEREICRSRLRHNGASRALAITVDRLRHVCGRQRRLLPPAQGHVDLDARLGDLASALVRARAGGRDIRLHLRLAPLRAESRFAWHPATVVAELLTNAPKHGSTRSRGQIWLPLEPSGREVSCMVRDDGIGAADGRPKGAGHGIRIVEAIAGDLGGTVERVTSATSVRLVLPMPGDARREPAAGTAHGGTRL